MTPEDHKAAFTRDLAGLLRLVPSVLIDHRVALKGIGEVFAALELEQRNAVGVWRAAEDESYATLGRQWEVMSVWNRWCGRDASMKRYERLDKPRQGADAKEI